MNNYHEQPRPEQPSEQTTGLGYLPPQPGYPPQPVQPQQPMQSPLIYPPQPPMPYPEQPVQPYQQHAVPGQYPQQIQYPHPGYAPYPYQQMPPQPINVVVNTSNVNSNTNMVGGGYVVVKKRNMPMLISIIYFCLIGFWLGFYWAIIGIILSAFGSEAGRKMMKQLPMVFFLRSST